LGDGWVTVTLVKVPVSRFVTELIPAAATAPETVNVPPAAKV